MLIRLNLHTSENIKKKKKQNIGAPHTNLLLVYLRLLFHPTKTAGWKKLLRTFCFIEIIGSW